MRARYYSPELRRFVNADIIPGEISQAVTLNRYAYANGNPVSNVDPFGLAAEEKNGSKFGITTYYGQDPAGQVGALLGGMIAELILDPENAAIKDIVKWVMRNAVKQPVKFVQNKLAEVDVTYSWGTGLAGSLGMISVNGQVGWAVDTEGNIALQATPGFALTSGEMDLSFFGYQTITNATSVDKLSGWGTQIGGTVTVPVEGIPVMLGADVNFIPNGDVQEGEPAVFHGATFVSGLSLSATGYSAEGHTASGHTFNLFTWNVFDVLDDMFDVIEEW